MTDEVTVFEVTPKQSQIVSDARIALRKLASKSSTIGESLAEIRARFLKDGGLKDDATTAPTGDDSGATPDAASSESDSASEDRAKVSSIKIRAELLTLTSEQELAVEALPDIAEITGKFDTLAKTANGIGDGMGVAAILENARSKISKEDEAVLEEQASTAEASLLRLIWNDVATEEKRAAGDPETPYFPISLATDEDTPHSPIFEIRYPNTPTTGGWQENAMEAISSDWPTIIPFIGESDDENSDESDGEAGKKSVSLWTVDESGYRQLKKVQLMKRAWRRSRFKYVMYSCLYKAVRQSTCISTTLDFFMKSLEESRDSCGKYIEAKKTALAAVKIVEKERAEERKTAAKEIADEIKRAAKERSQNNLDQAFVDGMQQPISTLLPKKKKGMGHVVWREKLVRFWHEETRAPTATELELITVGGGFCLSDGTQKTINSLYRTDLDSRLSEIGANWGSVKKSVDAVLTGGVKLSGEPLSDDARDFDAIIERSTDDLRAALADIRIEKGPLNPLQKLWDVLMKTVSKLKGIPLALTSMVAVSTPIIVFFRGSGDPLDDIKKFFLGEVGVIFSMTASVIAICVFLFLGLSASTNEYYRSFKKARDSAKKCYEKELKKAVSSAYGHYTKHLSFALAAWKKSPVELARTLKQTAVNDSADVSTLQDDIKALGAIKKNLDDAKKACEKLKKDWDGQVIEVKKIAIRCGVFQ
ncbi:MAG: hypothetical protein AAF483_13855 [Planctomycetota bacterium]